MTALISILRCRHSSGSLSIRRSSVDNPRVRQLQQGGEQKQQMMYEQAAQRIQAIHQASRDDAGAEIVAMKEKILESQMQHEELKRKQRLQREEQSVVHRHKIAEAELAAAKEMSDEAITKEIKIPQKAAIIPDPALLWKCGG